MNVQRGRLESLALSQIGTIHYVILTLFSKIVKPPEVSHPVALSVCEMFLCLIFEGNLFHPFMPIDVSFSYHK